MNRQICRPTNGNLKGAIFRISALLAGLGSTLFFLLTLWERQGGANAGLGPLPTAAVAASTSDESQNPFIDALCNGVAGGLVSFVLAGLTAFAVLRAVKTSLTQPLEALSQALRSIAADEDAGLPPLPRHADDSIRRLSASIDGLLERYHQHFEAKQALLRFSLDRVSEAAYLVDQDARFRDVNAEAVRALGYSREQLLRMSIPDIDPEFSMERWREEGFKVKPDQTLTFETVHKAADGRTFPVEISAVYSEFDGKPYNLALARDISERKQAERELRASEARFRHLFEESPVAYQSLDIQGRYLDVNPGLCRLLGYTRDELLGRCFDEFWIDAIQPQFLSEFEGFKQRGKVNNELQLRCKDGRVLFIALDGIIQRDEAGKFVRTHCILHDITPYRMAEQALMHYAAIVASSEDAIISKDLSGTIMSWNGGAESLFGYRAEEMLGKPIAMIIPEERREEEGMIMTGISEGRTFKHYETQRRRKDGQLVDVSVTVSPVRDRQGVIVGASKIARDITERKRAETELQRHREHLEELVNARTNALEALNGELEAFSFSVSHDLRTPLRAIDGFARLLAKKYAGQLDEEGHRLIRVVCQNTERMSRLIDDILAFSRVGRGELHPAPVDMGALLLDVWTELEPQRQGRKIDLELAPLPPAMGDAASLRQVWSNLLCNAIKFTQPRAEARIWVDARQEGRENWYRVRDNGVGFDPAYRHKLFGVFQRLHAVDEFEGTGIGLAIVKRVVGRHGGRVDADATLDQGASFSFTLPAAVPKT